MIAGHLVPHGRQRAKIQVRERAVAGLLRPVAELSQLVEFLGIVEQAGGPAQGVIQSPQAEVIATAFDQHGGELQRHHAPQQRQVLLDQLLLEADRMRGNDHAGGRSSEPCWPAVAKMAGTR